MTNETDERPKSNDSKRKSKFMPFFRRKKSCVFSGEKAIKADYKDIKLLSRFISDQGKIIPGRITGTSTKYQRKLKKELLYARYLALLPYVIKG